MYKKLTEEEEILYEVLMQPRGFCETLFSNIDNLMEFEGEKFCRIRPYQESMQSYEFPVADDNEQSEKENFLRRKGAGDGFAIGARRVGKSLVFLVLDIIQSIVILFSWDTALGSYDATHIRKIFNDFMPVVDYHPCFKGIKQTYQQNPQYLFISKNGFKLTGVNENVINPRKAGESWFSLHTKKMWYEEFSKTNPVASGKRTDAVSELGCISRFSGMTDVTKHTPAGELLKSPKMKDLIINVPQFCVAKDTQVLMSDLSYKPIYKIKKGDEILSYTDKEPFCLIKAKVLNKVNTGTKQTKTVQTSKNIIRVTEDHKFLIKRGKWDIYWKKVKDFYPLKEITYAIPKLYDINKNYYKGALLGFLEAEAHLKNKRHYTVFQKCENDSFEFLLNVNGIIYTKKQDRQSPDGYRYYISTKSLEYINKINENILTDIDIASGFISGFFLADGCISKKYYSNSNKFQVSIGQKNKCDILEKVLDFANIKYKKYKGFKGCFLYYFNRFDVPLYLPYSNKAKLYVENIIGSTVTSLNKESVIVKEGEIEETYDLTTESGTFIANGFLVHNCNPMWDDKLRTDTLDRYKSEASLLWKMFVVGEIIEDGYSPIDMDRVRNCYSEKKQIKNIEITKETYDYFKNIIIIDKPQDTVKTHIAADIGLTAPTEIFIIFETETKLKYRYNITLRKLDDKQIYEVLKWLGESLGADTVACDQGDGSGRAIVRQLLEVFPKENIFGYDGSAKIVVGFDKDKDGNIKRDDKGKPIVKEEYMSEWSVQVLKTMFYDEKFDFAFDPKFDEQISSLVCVKSGNRILYSISGEDHLFDAAKVFACAYWQQMFTIIHPIKKKVFCKVPHVG